VGQPLALRATASPPNGIKLRNPLVLRPFDCAQDRLRRFAPTLSMNGLISARPERTLSEALAESKGKSKGAKNH
jgi:hypothetical protein